MRPALIALTLLLSLLLPNAARADTFQYTLSWYGNNYYSSSAFFYSFNGSYTFTLNSEITGPTLVYGTAYTPPMTGPYTYAFASDLTYPSTVNLESIVLDPGSGPQNAFSVQMTSDEYTALIYLPQSSSDPGLYRNFAGGPGGYDVSLRVEDLGTTPTPEPSTLLLLATGAAGCALRLRRRA